MKYLSNVYTSGRAQGPVVMFHAAIKSGRGESDIAIEVSAEHIVRLAEALKAQTPEAHSGGHAAWHVLHGVPVPCPACSKTC